MQSENCVFEYHGDFWHGNPKIYNQEEMNSITKTTYGELYNKTLKKHEYKYDINEEKLLLDSIKNSFKDINFKNNIIIIAYCS